MKRRGSFATWSARAFAISREGLALSIRDGVREGKLGGIQKYIEVAESLLKLFVHDK